MKQVGVGVGVLFEELIFVGYGPCPGYSEFKFNFVKFSILQ
jgi:hypothetical protein